MRTVLIALVVVLAGCARDAAASPDADPVAPTVPAPTVAAAPAPGVLDEVEAAYRRAWAVYAAAVGRVDPTGLPTAFADSALVLKRREVAGLRRAGEAIRVRVGHHLDIALIDAETAIVTDVLDNHMVRVDARTRRALEPDPDDVLTRAFTLRREGGTWKVTEAVALG